MHCTLNGTLFLCVQDSLYGELLICGERDSSPFCIIREFDDMAVANEYDCPLLTLSHDLRIIHSNTVTTALSICHECTDSCVFIDHHGPYVIERDTVCRTRFIYKHDWSIELFSLNIYCTNHQ